VGRRGAFFVGDRLARSPTPPQGEFLLLGCWAAGRALLSGKGLLSQKWWAVPRRVPLSARPRTRTQPHTHNAATSHRTRHVNTIRPTSPQSSSSHGAHCASSAVVGSRGRLPRTPRVRRRVRRCRLCTVHGLRPPTTPAAHPSTPSSAVAGVSHGASMPCSALANATTHARSGS
jgi:hypothetical protein